eukprot:355326-Pleurochrysis_carterae.AAC.1
MQKHSGEFKSTEIPQTRFHRSSKRAPDAVRFVSYLLEIHAYDETHLAIFSHKIWELFRKWAEDTNVRLGDMTYE